MIKRHHKPSGRALLNVFILMLSTPLLGNESADNLASCGNSPEARELIRLIKNHPGQQRQSLKCHPLLNDIAQLKAHLIIDSEDVWHHAGRMSPNQLLRHHGFKLPRTYPLFGNQVEALAGGMASVDEVLTDFINSEPHRMLLLGEDPFFAAQDQMGVAYVHQADAPHEHYWVVIIADERNQTIVQEPQVEVKPPVINKKPRNKRSIRDKLYQRKVRRRL